MCGIAGILRVHRPDAPIPPHYEAIPESWLDILDESIKHRGPDGAGRFRDRATRPDGTVVDVAFVHRRLSIIDHADGAQPMVHVRHADGTGELLKPDSAMLVRARSASEGSLPLRDPTVREGSERPDAPPPLRSGLVEPHTIDATALPPDTDLVAVAFNGCIYNHRELRAELEALGHRFETDHSDTEVLVHGWREHGMLMQDRLDAMFAFLLWDRRTGQMVSAQDITGEKPLYTHIHISGDIWFYSTSTRSLIVDDFETERGISQCRHRLRVGYAIHDWLRKGCDTHLPTQPGFLSPAQGYWLVIPNRPKHGGELLVAGNTEAFGAHRKWRPPERGEPEASKCCRSEIVQLLIDTVELAVTSRLEADAPLGVFLSGGLDSALIAAIAHKSRPDIRAFTVRMPHPDYDESEQAAATAAAIGIEHTILDCQPNPATDLVHLIEQLGLPFGDSSLLPTYWVSRAAREHIKVALSGDGGDELFGGYRRHTINTTLNRWHRVLRFIPDPLLDQRDPKSRSSYLARLAVAARYGGYDELLSIFPTPDLRRLASVRDEEPLGDDTFRPVDDPLRHDFANYLPNDLLRKTDTASMAVGLEVRAPFLARELVEAAMRTPLDVLMPGGERKGLLKQVARKYLPPEIVDRPKQGFAIPIGEWFRTDYGSMRQLLYDHLESADPFPGLADAGVEINMGFVRRMLREHDAAGEKSINPWHGRDHSQRLYMLLVLSIWAKWLRSVRSGNDKAGRS